MTSVSKPELISIIRQYAAFLPTPDSINSTRLLWAISGVESSFGLWCGARHEIEYCNQKHWHKRAGSEECEFREGMHSSNIANLTHQYGCWAHCSYGWAQLMFPNVRGGFTPFELDSNPEKVAQALLSFLKSEVMPHIQTLEDFCRIYNGPATTPEYIQQFRSYYAQALPVSIAAQEGASA